VHSRAAQRSSAQRLAVDRSFLNGDGKETFPERFNGFRNS
jgi:hypothetical protein